MGPYAPHRLLIKLIFLYKQEPHLTTCTASVNNQTDLCLYKQEPHRTICTASFCNQLIVRLVPHRGHQGELDADDRPHHRGWLEH